MATNPHLAGDMRRDLNQLQLLYDMGELSPERFRELLRKLGNNVNEVEFLIDDLDDAAPLGVTPAGLQYVQGALQSKAEFAKLPADRVRFRGHLGVIDGDRA